MLIFCWFWLGGKRCFPLKPPISKGHDALYNPPLPSEFLYSRTLIIFILLYFYISWHTGTQKEYANRVFREVGIPTRKNKKEITCFPIRFLFITPISYLARQKVVKRQLFAQKANILRFADAKLNASAFNKVKQKRGIYANRS